MRNSLLASVVLVAALTACAPLFAASRSDSDLAVISAIRNDGLQGSHVQDHLSWLADVYGPRVTGTPALLAASDWAIDRFKGWGLTDARREFFRFGEGWEMKKSALRMISPQPMQIIGYPIGWTPGTDGEVTGEVVHARLETPADLDTWRGKLRGKIVLIQRARVVELPELPLVHRHSSEDLEKFSGTTPIPRQWLKSGGDGDVSALRGLYGYLDSASLNAWRDRLIAFLKEEGVIAVLERGPDSAVRPASAGEMTPGSTQRIDGGTVFAPTSLPGMNNQQRLLPWLIVAVEQYNRMIRILELGVPVTMALDVEVAWYPESEPGNGFNTLAEIPGKERRREVVILGAHLDGAHTASAAVDNGAGVAIVMEAARLLRRAGVTPRRTIRFALWGGEENGILGSRAYVNRHYGDPAVSVCPGGEAGNVSVYFNIDSGSGPVRAVSIQHNLLAEPVLAEWIEPLRDLGVEAIGRRGTQAGQAGGNFTSGSDHLPFDAAGIPTVQMIQDRLDYFSRTAHSNFDYADRASASGMIQASVALAVLAYQASMSDAPLPRRAAPPPLGSGTADSACR